MFVNLINLAELVKKKEVTPVPPPRLRKIRKRMVVPPSSRVLRSHARLSPPSQVGNPRETRVNPVSDSDHVDHEVISDYH
jgi:hypothetical protein